MKATRKGVLAKVLRRRETPTDTAPVVTDVVPEAELSVEDTDAFMLLSVAIDHADHLKIGGNMRAAAMRGMRTLAENDPERMREILTEVGAHGAEPLRAAIMELGAVGRARGGER